MRGSSKTSDMSEQMPCPTEEYTICIFNLSPNTTVDLVDMS